MRAETLDVQGRPARVWRGGGGPPLMLLQGGMADAALHWAPVWDALSERFDVIAPDWPGFGGSEALPVSTYPAMLAWLEALQAATAGAPVDMAGNSFGATMALLYAAARPAAVRRLVLIDGGGLVPEATAHALRSMPADDALLAQAGAAAFSRAALLRMVAREATLTDEFMAAAQSNPIILRILRESLTGPAPAALRPVCPTLVLWGEADRHSPPDMGRIIATTIPGAQFKTVVGAGHLPQVESPQAVAAILTEFLTDPD